LPDTNDAPNSVRGDYSIAELRGLMAGDPKPAAAGEANESKETPAAEGEKPDARTAPDSGTDDTQASGDGKLRGTDGKFKAKSDGEPGGDDTAAGEVPAGVQKRIDKAVRAQRDAERRADEAERKLRDQGSRPGDGQTPGANNAQAAADAKPNANAKPDVKDFQTYDAYIEALSDWKYEQRRADERVADQERSRKAAEKEILKQHASRVTKAKESLTDFDDVMAEAKDLPISRDMHNAIVTSDLGPELAYRLAKDPGEVKRIAALPPLRQVAEMGKIEAAIEAEAAAAKAKAEKPADKKPDRKPLPKPAANVGGSGGGAKEPKLEDPDIDMGTFKRIALAGLRH
jgi:hypothetical protein